MGTPEYDLERYLDQLDAEEAEQREYENMVDDLMRKSRLYRSLCILDDLSTAIGYSNEEKELLKDFIGQAEAELG